MEIDPTHSLRLMLEAVDELVSLLETQKSLLTEGQEMPEELLHRLHLASEGVGEVAARLREAPDPTGGKEARELKTRLEQRFVLAFRLTRENEGRMRSPRAEIPSGGRPSGPRGSLREIEKRYRERMRVSSGLAPSGA